MGRFVGFVLGFVEVVGSSLILSLGSLIFRAVRWICPGFVDFMGCSLDYRFLPAVQPFFILCAAASQQCFPVISASF